MTDLYLMFADEAEAAEHLLNAEGRLLHVNTDVLGIIYDRDDTDPENPVFTALPGWHVNVRTESYDPALDAFRVYPATPRRVWWS
ncbi:MAG: hypothetical protein RIR91_224 [Verrucomicrobiota bacterium]|jgi:hypothetical protein